MIPDLLFGDIGTENVFGSVGWLNLHKQLSQHQRLTDRVARPVRRQ
jgi:hypothetical protein